MPVQEFLQLFNDLEKELQNQYQSEDPVYQLLGRAHEDPQQNPIKRNWELVDIARRLRNLLVHETSSSMREIAIPSEELLSGLRRVLEQVRHPRRIKEIVARKPAEKLSYFQRTDRLSQVLEKVAQFDYAQFPIFDETGYVGLLTGTAIASWLAKAYHGNQPGWTQLDQVLIEEVLPREQESKKVGRIYEEETIEELLTIFEQVAVRVVLVCKRADCQITGPQDILGVLTTSDAVRAYQEVQIDPKEKEETL